MSHYGICGYNWDLLHVPLYQVFVPSSRTQLSPSAKLGAPAGKQVPARAKGSAGRGGGSQGGSSSSGTPREGGRGGGGQEVLQAWSRDPLSPGDTPQEQRPPPAARGGPHAAARGVFPAGAAAVQSPGGNGVSMKDAGECTRY